MRLAYGLAAILLNLPLVIQAEDVADRQAATKTAVQSAINYLQDRGETWKDSRQCVSCHHVSWMTWSMHEAKKHGVEIDEELLKTATDWLFADGDPAKTFQRNSPEEEEYSNPLPMATPFVLLAESNDPDEPARRQFVVRLMKGIVDAQESDGSWKPLFGRKPIIGGSRESLALWLTNITRWPNQPEELQSLVAESRSKAVTWLGSHKEDQETHVIALRLWMLADSGAAKEDIAAVIETLVKRQREDGGWSQIESRASDAYATGNVLYAFQIAGVDPHSEPMRRGVDFLLKTQAKDGSWLMISRENPPILIHAVSAATRKPVLVGQEPNTSTGRNIEPISFVATAWATVALSRTLP
jgi:squalene cyclase